MIKSTRQRLFERMQLFQLRPIRVYVVLSYSNRTLDQLGPIYYCECKNIITIVLDIEDIGNNIVGTGVMS